MRVLVLAEYYPRAGDPTSGIWAHRQALATQRAGVELRTLVLHRPIPPLSSLEALCRRRPGGLRTVAETVRQPPAAWLDGIRVDYLRYVSPPRPWSYAWWGAWAAPALRRALRRIRLEFPFDLIHAHYAVPAGDAVRRADPAAPMVVSVHGGDVLGRHADSSTVSAALGHARLVLANSAGTARRCTARGAEHTRVVHLGTDVPAAPAPPPAAPRLVSVGNLIERKRHSDVIEALALLAARWPELTVTIVGDGPERAGLAALAAARGIADRVTLTGRLAPEEAVAIARTATVFVLPSVAEAFGVAYVEAMAAGVPAIGCTGEDGPEELAAAGGGIELVAPRDPGALAATIEPLLADPTARARLGAQARATVERGFTWEHCGAETVAAYREALDG